MNKWKVVMTDRYANEKLMEYAARKLADEIYMAWKDPLPGETFEAWRDRATRLEGIPSYLSKDTTFLLTEEHARQIYKELQAEAEGGNND